MLSNNILNIYTSTIGIKYSISNEDMAKIIAATISGRHGFCLVLPRTNKMIISKTQSAIRPNRCPDQMTRVGG